MVFFAMDGSMIASQDEKRTADSKNINEVIR
jgi:hypothetical protein